MTNQRCANRSFQGYAFIQWNQTHKRASFLKGFVDAAPPGAFSIVDMTAGGDGEWKMWDNAAFFGAKFIWTALHDFGGDDGLKVIKSGVFNWLGWTPCACCPLWRSPLVLFRAIYRASTIFRLPPCRQSTTR